MMLLRQNANDAAFGPVGRQSASPQSPVLMHETLGKRHAIFPSRYPTKHYAPVTLWLL